MSAAILYMPFNEQAKLPNVQPFGVRETKVEDLFLGELRFKFSIAAGRALTSWYQRLDEDDAILKSALDRLSAQSRVAKKSVVTNIEDFKCAKRDSQIFTVIDSNTQIKTPEGLIAYMKIARSQGGTDNTDPDMGRNYRLLQEYLGKELCNIGIRGIQVI